MRTLTLQHMVMLTLWNVISPQLCRVLADYGVQDMEAARHGQLDMDPLEVLADLGTHGLYQNHCWRDFWKKLPTPQLAKPHSFLVPLKSKLKGCFTKATHMSQGFPIDRPRFICICTSG